MRLAAAILILTTLGLGASGGEPGSLPHDIAFWDERHGLLAAGGSISTTDDGGRTWTVRQRGRHSFVLAVSGKRDAWALSGRTLLHSHDRGRSWTRTRMSRTLSRLDFGTRRIGWGLERRELFNGNRVTVLYGTADGGRTWRRLPNPCAGWYDFAEAALAAARRGWMVCAGQPGVGHQEKAVYETRDGGKTWRNRACACFHGSRGRIPSFGYVAGIDFTPSGTGLLLQRRGSPVLLSHNAGRTWSSTSAGLAEVEYGVDVSIVSAETAFALVEPIPPRGRVNLRVTRDGGRTWRTSRVWR